MAKISQCEQCDRYNQESGLCRKNWCLIEFDDTECDFFGNEKSVEEVVRETNEIGPIEEAKNNTEMQHETHMEQRQRHGCATAWLGGMLGISLFVMLTGILLSIFSNSDEESLTEYMGFVVSAGIILTSVILLYKWNIWGLYIYVGASILGILASIFIDGKIGSSISSLACMIVAFNMEAKDGNTFFDNLGLTSRRKRIQKKLQSYYIRQSKRFRRDKLHG